MHTLTIGMSDTAYEYFLYAFKDKTDDVTIIKDEKIDDFKVDKKRCLNVLEKIKKGDTSGFKETTLGELFEELAI